MPPLSGPRRRAHAQDVGAEGIYGAHSRSLALSGTQYPSDPSKALAEWMQRASQAQGEFVKSLGNAMGCLPAGDGQAPSGALGEAAGRAAEMQARMMRMFGSMQARGLDKMADVGQLAALMMPNVCNWGAYKTAVGNNGRISIPEAERRALGLSDGDLVQVIVVPISGSQRKREVKE